MSNCRNHSTVFACYATPLDPWYRTADLYHIYTGNSEIYMQASRKGAQAAAPQRNSYYVTVTSHTRLSNIYRRRTQACVRLYFTLN